MVALISKGKAAAYKLTHARILLAADIGDESDGEVKTDKQISKDLHISDKTVSRVR